MTSDQRPKMNFVKRFFLICSGAHLETLQHKDCWNEHNKYIGIGSAVFFTAVFAFISSSYAFYLVFQNTFFSLLMGLVWAGFIFSLDRFIVSTLKKENEKYVRSPFWNGFLNKMVEILKASPRMVLAVLLALIISKPLELKIFEREIDNELVIMQQAVKEAQEASIRSKFEERIQVKEGRLAELQAGLAEKDRNFKAKQKLATEELDGTGGSKKKNAGPIYRKKLADEQKAEQELNAYIQKYQPIIATLEREIRESDSLLQVEIQELKTMKYDGLLARIAAFGNLTKYRPAKEAAIDTVMIRGAVPPVLGSEAPPLADSLAVTPLPQVSESPVIDNPEEAIDDYKNNVMYYANLAIIFLFIVIEIAPILFKILSSRGNYDVRIQNLEEIAQRNATEELIKKSSALESEIAKEKVNKLNEVRALVDANFQTEEEGQVVAAGMVKDSSLRVLKNILKELELGTNIQVPHLSSYDVIIDKLINVVDSVEDEKIKKELVTKIIEDMVK